MGWCFEIVIEAIGFMCYSDDLLRGGLETVIGPYETMFEIGLSEVNFLT